MESIANVVSQKKKLEKVLAAEVTKFIKETGLDPALVTIQFNFSYSLPISKVFERIGCNVIIGNPFS